MKAFMQHLDSIALIDNVIIDFIYILNPYGFEHDSRYNGNGIDINRDFISFETEEVRYLINSIKDETYFGVYDFHEHSATTGFLLYAYSTKSKKAAAGILAEMQNQNIPLETEFVDVVLKSRNGLLYVPFYAKLYFMHIQNQATTGLYFDKTHSPEVLVIETPKRMEMTKRREMIKLLLQYVFGI